MKPDLTDAQVIILDTIKSVLIRASFRTGSIAPAWQAAIVATLQENGLSWSDLIEYSAK